MQHTPRMKKIKIIEKGKLEQKSSAHKHATHKQSNSEESRYLIKRTRKELNQLTAHMCVCVSCVCF